MTTDKNCRKCSTPLICPDNWAPYTQKARSRICRDCERARQREERLTPNAKERARAYAKANRQRINERARAVNARWQAENHEQYLASVKLSKRKSRARELGIPLEVYVAVLDAQAAERKARREKGPEQ